MTGLSPIVTLPDGEPVLIGANRLELLVSPDARLARYIALIDGASERVCLISYIWEDGDTGRRIRDALSRAAARGVKVRAVVDSFGSGDTTAAFFEPLRGAGGEVLFFSRRWRSAYLIRNHQKLLIVDGQTLFIGGFNLADSYFDARAETGWTDLGLVMMGPDTTAMCDWFEDLFAITRDHDGQWLRLRRMIRNWQLQHPPGGRFQWLVGGPTHRLSPWARSIRSDLTVGRRIDMVMAYFSPGQGMLRRLGRAARRGPVRLVNAAKSDNGATIGAARLLYGYLLRKGISVHEFRPQRLHMKLAVVDDAVYIGSANFDMRSLFVNLEVMLRIEDATLAAQARTLIDAMSCQSEVVSREWIKSRAGWLTKLRWILSWFVVNTLDYSVARRLNFGLEADPE
jgi:cardiolipin synthase A/B